MGASIPLLNLIAAIILIGIILHGINCNGECIQREREALLELKRGLVDPSMRLASWDGEEDCCSWSGVICNNFTGRVLELHLQSTVLSMEEYYSTSTSSNYDEYSERSKLGGNISESLLELKHLNYLDLSNNFFHGISIPSFFGFMSSLRYLNLSKAGFEGLIPHQLGNLTNLQCLDLSSYMYIDKLVWLSGLSSLKFLDLSSVDLSKAIDWMGSLGKLPSLQQLYLSDCLLTQTHPVSNISFSSLSVLDLSHNNFYGFIPGWISSLTSLAYLDLSDNKFIGPIPSLHYNLTSLRGLDLSHNHFSSSIPSWLGGFTHLELLDLSGNELGGKIPDAIGNLTSLDTLDLSHNDFLGRVPMSFKRLCNLRSLSISTTSMSQEINELIEILSDCVSEKLESLDLSRSNFSGYLSNLLKKFESLDSLDLSGNLITGPLPITFGEMTSLTYLDLSSNKLNGSIPLSFGRLENLEKLDLSFNSLESIPISFGQLERLEELDVSFNLLEGEVSEIHFENLTSLITFYASGNHLILRVNPHWIPPFRYVTKLYLRFWDVGPMFPSWLQHLNNLEHLDLSNSNISSTLPTWFHNFSSILYQLNLSHNQMYGMIHNLSNDDSDYSFIDLSSNYFEGPLPYMSSSPGGIDLSNNFFSGSIHNFLCNKIQQNTEVVILKENLLHGEIPDCWMHGTYVIVLELSNNNFSGKIPQSIGRLTNLEILNLRKNNFTGDLPSTLQNCTSLIVLDFGENELRGEIPSWIGEYLRKLKILNFRENKFHGHMCEELCRLSKLQILDVAGNNLNGTIPTCVSNLMGMSQKISSSQGTMSFSYTNGPEHIGSSSIVKKGQMVEYSTILQFVQSLDLSNNNFIGEIPNGITSLLGLQSLNLSHNFLTGRIPKNIGAMKTIESLDLSQNQLFGEIPQSMSSMTFLSSLNVSNNNLSGQIPSSTQLQSLNESSFIGNNLCGPPLIKECSTNGATPPSAVEGRGGHSNKTEVVDWFYFYVSLAPGFVVGFWCVVGPLVFNKRWRISYFNFLELLWDKIWVQFRLHIDRFVRNHGL